MKKMKKMLLLKQNKLDIYKNSATVLTMNSILSSASVATQAVINKPVAGDILCGSYGYEASIARFYKVLKVTNASVVIAQLDANNVYKQGGMDWTSTPILDSVVGDELTKRFKPCGDSYFVKLSSYCTLYKWSGKSVECYNYH